MYLFLFIYFATYNLRNVTNKISFHFTGTININSFNLEEHFHKELLLPIFYSFFSSLNTSLPLSPKLLLTMYTLYILQAIVPS